MQIKGCNILILQSLVSKKKYWANFICMDLTFQISKKLNYPINSYFLIEYIAIYLLQVYQEFKGNMVMLNGRVVEVTVFLICENM